MAIVTCLDLITLALKTAGVNGVGQTPSAEDSNDSMSFLQMMVGGWQRKRWLVPNLIDLAFVSTGALSYTIGPYRPDKVMGAFARLLVGSSSGSTSHADFSGADFSSINFNTVGATTGLFSSGDFSSLDFSTTSATAATGLTLDYPLSVIEAHEDYYQIRLKNLSTIPTAVFYDTIWPVGSLYFWPVPPVGQYELHVLFKAPLPAYVLLTDLLNLPPEYTEALFYSLVVRLAMNYGLDPKPSHVGAMRAALNTLRVANAQVGTLDTVEVASRRGSSVAASSSPAFQSGIW